jgi:hypothetical protein
MINMKKSQILGLLIIIISLALGFLWEKTFKYADILDFVFGVLTALGISMVLKILPIMRKLDN